jgi:hypothetical protein
MFRYILSGLGLAVAIVAFQLYLNQSGREQTGSLAVQPFAETTPGNKIAPVPVNQVQPGAPLNEQSAGQPATNSANTFPTNNRPALAEENNSAWQADLDAPAPPTRFSNKGISPTPLKLKKQTIARASVGDTLSLPIPQTNQDYEMSIQQVGEHQNGDKTLKGHLTNQPEYTVVVTQGSSATYATINTPDGSFLLEADQEQGWLMAATDLDNLIDPNLADYRIPGINRNTVN